MDRIIRKRFIARGQVQGVGFRPFVWRLAHDAGLAGIVRNSSEGVVIEVQGESGKIGAFEHGFRTGLPPLARLTGLDTFEIPLLEGEDSFRIAPSAGEAAPGVLVSPDVAVCSDCLKDIFGQGNRRAGYAFTNCCNCGPRFTITKSLPYDRAGTVMECFPMCEECAREYGNPADRRFHAQPVACPVCGPALWFVDKADQASGQTRATDANRINALEKAAKVVATGGILALKGLGGFQLICDARNETAVKKLRLRKKRPHKALAVMSQIIEDIEKFCSVSEASRLILEGNEKPVCLCPALPDAAKPLAMGIAPDTADIGVMLPATPLHALLLAKLESLGLQSPCVVATSANAPGEPICLGNREALEKLGDLADAWLLHDRDILCRADDSVAAAMTPPASPNAKEESFGHPLIIRRARGYVPEPVDLHDLLAAPVLGAGAELKSTFCLTRNGQAFPGQYIGDLKNPGTLDFYSAALAHLRNLLAVEPCAVVCDLHPDFISTNLATGLARNKGIPLIKLQHHAAHAAAVLIENGALSPALALCMDGSGLGIDGAIWGCELIKMDLSVPGWSRLASLKTFSLPGGEAAIREPWRIARALGNMAGIPSTESREGKIIDEMLQRNLNSPSCSSLGRVFDGVSSMLGLCDKITYEGQAAILLEKGARNWLKNNSLASLPDLPCEIIESSGMALIGVEPLIMRIAEEKGSGSSPDFLAAAFHQSVAKILARVCANQGEALGICQVGLTGGCMQNRVLAWFLDLYLRQYGMIPLYHNRLPPGDGSISVGQAAWGSAILKNGALNP